MWRNKNANTAFKMPVGDIKSVNIALTQEFCKITLWSSEISSKCNICNSLIWSCKSPWGSGGHQNTGQHNITYWLVKSYWFIILMFKHWEWRVRVGSDCETVHLLAYPGRSTFLSLRNAIIYKMDLMFYSASNKSSNWAHKDARQLFTEVTLHGLQP